MVHRLLFTTCGRSVTRDILDKVGNWTKPDQHDWFYWNRSSLSNLFIGTGFTKNSQRFRSVP
ncbi:hypothetical protein H5410_040560 [Solanum commersonii]|uniref:Uncharacterized protein n=1 Tax=Solanum commersonii TaxID=4109 RepID=A0A9J5XSW0_SOLCO|nr:hypothetical protein H5410_040560 [Solanum commersonii]